MAAKNKAAKAGAAAVAVKNSPYVKALAEDEELRANLYGAYESARGAVGRLQNGKHPTKQVFDDKKLQKDVKAAAESFKEAAVALREAPEGRRSGAGRQADPRRDRRRRRRARGLGGPAQEGARRPVRRRGGVRVHLDHVARAGAGDDVLVARTRHLAGSGRAPTGRPSSSYSPAMKSRTSTSAPGRGSVSLP